MINGSFIFSALILIFLQQFMFTEILADPRIITGILATRYFTVNTKIFGCFGVILLKHAKKKCISK